MSSIVQRLSERKLIKPPKFVPHSVQYEVVMGSAAYGVSDHHSDLDVYGFCIPNRHFIFPHTAGFIAGFGTAPPVFNQYQQHHIRDQKAHGGKGQEYDLTIYSIIRYFQLVMEGNPNMIDSLFVPRRCVLYSTQIGELVRENRHLFLSKIIWHKFKGYAYSQLHKMETKLFEKSSKRAEDVKKYGYSTKFAYHVVRLLDEVEQLLESGDLDLERNREQLKAALLHK